MAKKKKKKRTGEVEAGSSAAPRPAPPIAQRPFAEALRGFAKPAPKPAVTPGPGPGVPAVGASRPAAPGRVETAASPPGTTDAAGGGPAAAHGYADRAAYQQAMAGVRPLGGPPPRRRGTAPSRREDRKATTAAAAAAREAAEEAARARLDALVGGGLRFELERSDGGVRGRRSDAHPGHLASLAGGVAPEASLDLHGLRAEEAAREVRRFVRAAHRSGKRVVLLVFGKGHHSDGGAGVLGDRVVRELVEGGAGSVVLAFATAPERLGGEGALVLRLGLK